MSLNNFPLLNSSAWHQTTNEELKLAGFKRTVESPNRKVHLLHGNGFSSFTLSEFAAELPQDWNLYFTDIPGHGNSEQPSHRMPDWQSMASTIAQGIIDTTNLSKDEKVTGIGHSLGGVLTLLAAYEYPHLFDRIVLLDPPLFEPHLLVIQHFLRTTGIWKKTKFTKAVNNRREHWHSEEEMYSDLKKKRLYKNWQPQVLKDFINGATFKDENNGLNLLCDPRWEASIFNSYPKKVWKKIANIKVPVEVVTADNSYKFIRPATKRAMKLNNLIQRHDFGKSHCFPMEVPKDTAKFVVNLIE